jgi:hypothetical protein
LPMRNEPPDPAIARLFGVEDNPAPEQ